MASLSALGEIRILSDILLLQEVVADYILNAAKLSESESHYRRRSIKAMIKTIEGRIFRISETSVAAALTERLAGIVRALVIQILTE